MKYETLKLILNIDELEKYKIWIILLIIEINYN